jgi:hypothetical protein
MPFPQELNLDILAFQVLHDVGAALSEWSTGQPRNEEAFMNHLTGRLVRRRRGCDVGLVEPISVRSEIALLHRKGPKQTDKYGSDLAVTLYVDSNRYVKTALFQLKKSEECKFQLKREQLNNAIEDPRLAPRSFVLCFDEMRHGIRIKSVTDCLSEFDMEQETRMSDSINWTSLTQWMLAWISCEAGPESDPNDLASVESLLESYRLPDPHWMSPWVKGTKADQPEVVPAKAWAEFVFETSERLH